MGQHDRDQGDADRAADALDDVQARGRAGDLGAIEGLVGGRHRGHHRRAQAEAHHEQRDLDQHEGGVGAHLGQ